MNPIHAHPHQAGHAAHAARPTDTPEATQQPADSPETNRRGPVDSIELSAAAKRALESPGPGKSGGSTAHKARAFAEEHGLTGMPFGRIVSAIARGVEADLIPESPPAEPVEGGLEAPPADATDATATAPAEIGNGLDVGADAADPAAPADAGTVQTDTGAPTPAATGEDAAGSPSTVADDGANVVATVGETSDPTQSLIESLDEEDDAPAEPAMA